MFTQMKAVFTLGFVVIIFAMLGRAESPPPTSAQQDRCYEQGHRAIQGTEIEAGRHGWQYLINYDSDAAICYVWTHQFTSRNEFPHVEDRVFDPTNGRIYPFTYGTIRRSTNTGMSRRLSVGSIRAVVKKSSATHRKSLGRWVEKYFGFRRSHHSW